MKNNMARLNGFAKISIMDYLADSVTSFAVN